MDAFPRFTLRTWAVLDAVYGPLVLALGVWLVPWKTPAANGILIGYGLAVAAGAPGLWRGARWGWRLAVVTSLFGLAAGVVAVAGLVASWAYLRAVYGAFGAGASIACLLVAGMVFQLVGLYPALRLRALLRQQVRAAVGVASARAAGVAASLLVLFALLPIAVGLVVDRRFRLDPRPSLPAAALAQTLALVRARAEGQPPPATPALIGIHPGDGPLFATWWQEGRPVARASGRGRDLAESADAAGRALAAALPGGADLPGGRIRVDRALARAPVPRWPRAAFSLGLDPGLDGLVGEDGRLVFLPDDVLRAGVAGAEAPWPELGELRAGIDVGWMEDQVARAGVSGRLERVRTESWIETEGQARRLHRGNTVPEGPLSAREAALLAGDFILEQLQTDGRFRYRYQPYEVAYPAGEGDPIEYSLPRHAGTAYGLTLLYAYTRETRFRDGATAALQWLARQVDGRCGAGACLVEDGHASLGPAALTAIAFLTYQGWTGDRRYADLAGGLLTFLLSLQRPDGELDHRFDVRAATVVAEPPRMFASEQAALALVLGHRELGDGRFLAAAERLLDYLTGKKHDHFLGRFIYGADHWTCLAAEAASSSLPRWGYFEFCRGYATFMSRLQYPADEAGSAGDFAGHYGFGYVLVPQAPATAGFAEALLATLALGQRHGVDVTELRGQTRAALRALARDQLRPENSYLARSADRARGGMRRSLVEPEIRIDFVQHAASALARATALGLERL